MAHLGEIPSFNLSSPQINLHRIGNNSSLVWWLFALIPRLTKQVVFLWISCYFFIFDYKIVTLSYTDQSRTVYWIVLICAEVRSGVLLWVLWLKWYGCLRSFDCALMGAVCVVNLISCELRSGRNFKYRLFMRTCVCMSSWFCSTLLTSLESFCLPYLWDIRDIENIKP